VTELEVARYALRTFSMHPYFGGTYGPQPDSLYRLGPVGRHGFGLDSIWEDGTCTAQCLRDTYGIGRWEASKGRAFLPAPPGHKAPHMACTCGIYGALDYVCLQRQYAYEMSHITAVIAAEGRTVIGTRGLRTEYARVVAWSGLGLYATVAERQFVDAKRFGTTMTMLDAYQLPLDAGLGGDDGWGSGGYRWWG
jgi:hypothetical protein